MRVREAIDQAKLMKPHDFPDEIVTRWLNEIEGTLQVDTLGKAPEELNRYTIPGDDAAEMLVPFPYDRLYWMYLLAMIDFANGDYTSYQNSMQMVKDTIRDYKAWCIRTNHTCWQEGRHAD